jgi:hypothetical protein
MTAALLRVSVVAGNRRLDLAVPPSLPVAELVPGLARNLGVLSYDGLRLCTATGSVLDHRTGLAMQDVPDGAVLALAPEPPPTVHDDPAEALAATAPPGEPPRWWPLPSALALLLLGAAVLAVAADARAAGAVALLLLAGGLGAARSHSTAALVACSAASAYAAVAAALVLTDLRPGPGVPWAAAAGAVLTVSALAMAAVPSHRLLLLPGLVVGTAGAAIGAVLSVRPVPVAVPASVLLALGAVLAGAAPWLAAGRVGSPGGRVDLEALAAQASTARELLLGLSAGLAVLHVALVPVVARHGPLGGAVAACGSGFLLLRGRHQSASAPALLGLGGGLGLLATAAAALVAHPSWRPAGGVLLAGAGGVVLTAGWLHDRPSLLVAPVLRAVETLCLIALAPLVVLATGTAAGAP